MAYDEQSRAPHDSTSTPYWQKYERGKEHHNAIALYSNSAKYHRFYIGDQWHGLKSDREELPIFNFIKPVGKYKISMIAQNSMAIVYSDLRGGRQEILDQLNDWAARQWERGKLDSLSWSIIKQSFIAGDAYLYCFEEEGQLRHRVVATNNLYLADEQNPDLQEQDYLILDERVSVQAARDMARANGVPEEEVARIVSDEDTETQIGQSADLEIKGDGGKCNSILYLERTPEGLKFLRSTQAVVYVPEQTIQGLDAYPIAGMRWEEQPGSARGVSGVKHMIPNQLEVNKTAARRAIAVKRFAFPTLVYDAERIANADKLAEVGASVKIKNMAQFGIKSVVDYLNPAPISADAERLQSEFIDVTRDLEGAGDAATGQIDPSKASGEAIRAARDQAAIPLNEQISAYRQFVEDLALVWFQLFRVYGAGDLQAAQAPDMAGMETGMGMEMGSVQEDLQGLEVDIKVDVSPVDPFSRISQEIALERLFGAQAITFEEYVQALDDTSTVPKAKLEEILAQRQQMQEQQAQQEAMMQQQQMEQQALQAQQQEQSALAQTENRLAQADEVMRLQNEEIMAMKRGGV